MAALKFRGEPSKSLNPSHWALCGVSPWGSRPLSPCKKVASRGRPATVNGHLIACFCLSPVYQGLLALMGFRATSQIEGLLTVAVMGYSQQYESISPLDEQESSQENFSSPLTPIRTVSSSFSCERGDLATKVAQVTQALPRFDDIFILPLCLSAPE
jgi:hypothetical protein